MPRGLGLWAISRFPAGYTQRLGASPAETRPNAKRGLTVAPDLFPAARQNQGSKPPPRYYWDFPSRTDRRSVRSQLRDGCSRPFAAGCGEPLHAYNAAAGSGSRGGRPSRLPQNRTYAERLRTAATGVACRANRVDDESCPGTPESVFLLERTPACPLATHSPTATICGEHRCAAPVTSDTSRVPSLKRHVASVFTRLAWMDGTVQKLRGLRDARRSPRSSPRAGAADRQSA